jgi:hypothetical protein
MLNDMEVNRQNQVRFSALENLDDVYDVKINGAWENTTENIKSSAAEGPVTTS